MEYYYNFIILGTQSTTDSTSQQTDPVAEVEVVDEVNNTSEDTKSESIPGSSVENKDGPASIIKKMDADNNLVREKRLEFFNKRKDADGNGLNYFNMIFIHTVLFL